MTNIMNLNLKNNVFVILNIRTCMLIFFLNHFNITVHSQNEIKSFIGEQNNARVYLLNKNNIDCDTNHLIIESDKYKISSLNIGVTFSKISLINNTQLEIIVNCNVEEVTLLIFDNNSIYNNELLFREILVIDK